jgi:putative sterol carrier protein
MMCRPVPIGTIAVRPKLDTMRHRDGGTVGMGNATQELFDGLAARGQVPVLGRATGTLRIDLDRDGRTEHWRVEMRRGVVAVSRSDDPADCVIHADAALFDDLAHGRANAMAAALRGQLRLDGDPSLLVRFQRLLPAPTGRKMTASARTVGKRRG